MCSLCLSNPCREGCPNEDDPYSIGKCVICGKPIYEGEEYLDFHGDAHLDCVEDKGIKAVLQYAGIDVFIAEKED